jgi:hypothetical protein
MRGLRSTTATLLALALLAACAGEPPLTPEQLVEAFVERSRAGDRTYHADMRMEIRSGGVEMGDFTTVVSGTLDVAGPDYRLLYAQQMGVAGSEPMRVELVKVGGQTFYRDASDGTWTRGEDGMFLGTGNLDPFAGLTVEALEYAGPDDTFGEGLHRITARAPETALRDLLGVPDDADIGLSLDPGSTMEYHVDSTGTPVGAMLRFAGSSSSFGQTLSFSMANEYAFSAWGDPITIIAPPVR